MLWIDKRRGSGELEKYFHAYGITPKLSMLSYGDFSFMGKGPEGATVGVVIERKRIDDLVASMEKDRLAGFQLRGMAEEYDYGYLIVEGIWRPGPGGELQVLSGSGKDAFVSRGIQWSAVDGHMDSLELRAGMNVVRTSSKEETVRAIVNRYKRWQRDWESHTSHDRIYAPVNDGATGRGFTLVHREISLCEKMACQIPGIEQKARYVAEHFGSAADMARAGWEKWMEVVWKDRKGKKKKISKEMAQKIIKALRTSGDTGESLAAAMADDGDGEKELD